jgi:2-phosphosulfolactate phosphatase
MLIDAALNPAEIALLPKRDLSETTCVVFDVLRATSSMITALAEGAREILPVSSIEEALAAKTRRPEALLGGERHGERIEGFDLGNSPFEYRNLKEASIISTTTNGTIALRACDGARKVLVGAILNLAEVAKVVSSEAPARLLLVCAGTFETFALEDAWAAGRLVDLLGEPLCTDAARAALAVARLYPTALDALRGAKNGRALCAKGREAEVEWCARESLFPVAGAMVDGVIRLYEPSEKLSAYEKPATLSSNAR